MIFYVTGVNGFIGSQLAYRLLTTQPDSKVIGVYNARDAQGACEKHHKLIEHWRRFLPAIDLRNFSALAWNEFNPGLAGNEEFVVIHAAASTNFDDPIEFARSSNLATTVDLLNRSRQSPSLRRFVHISTAFVSACERGMVEENRIPRDFNNAYEQTKYESELAVMHSGLAYTIFRPSIVIGDSQTGYSKHFRVFYSMFRLWLTGVVPRAPIDQSAKADVVPIDFVVNSILKLMLDPQSLSQVINITAGLTSPSVREIFETGLKVFNEKPARFSPPLMLRVLSHPCIMPLLNHSLCEVLRTLSGHFPYFGSRHRVFSNKRLDSLLGGELRRKNFSDYGEGIFKYALLTRWGKVSRQMEVSS